MESEGSPNEQSTQLQTSQPSSNITRLATLMQHENVLQQFRDQNKQLESIVDYDCLRWLLDLIVEVGPEEDQARSCKLPFIASDVLSVDIKNFNDWLFVGCEDRPPLMSAFLRFLEKEPNYILAGYFSKILVSIIKRFHSVQSRYNEQLCQLMFAQQTQEGVIRHMYSRSMVEPIMKILTLRSKQKDYIGDKLQFLVKLTQVLSAGGDEEWFGDNIGEVFSSLIANEFSQKINYELALLTFGEAVVARIFGDLGANNTVKKCKAKIVGMYLKQLRAVRESKITDQRQAAIIQEGIGKKPELITQYCSNLLQFIREEVKGKCKGVAHILALLESLYLLIIIPKALSDQAETLLCSYLPDIFELIRLNPLNNILHNLIVRLSKQFGVHFKHQPERMLQYLNVLVGVLLTFNQIISQEHRRKVAYTGCLLNLSEFLLSVMETYKYEKTEEWAAYELSLCKLLNEISELRVGAYTIKPQHLPIVYNRSAIATTFKQFLRQDPIIEYEQSRAQKEQHFDELKQKKLEELILTKTTDLETAKFEVEEQFELYRYWKEGSRLKYDLDELMNDI